MNSVTSKQVVVFCSGAEHLRLETSHPILPLESGKFKCGETKIQVHGSPRDKDIVVVQSFGQQPNDDLMELILTIDALRRSGARDNLTVLLPLFPYSRQERKDDSGVPISARVVCDMLKIAGAKRIISLDLHATAIQGFVDSSIVFDQVPTLGYIGRFLSTYGVDPNWVLCSPDYGGLKRVKKLAKLMGIPGICVMDKDRLEANKVSEDSFQYVLGNVKGKKVLIFDDMLDTGGTLVGSIKSLFHHGALEVVFAGIHGICSGEVMTLLNGVRILLTNSTNWQARNPPASFTCINIKPLINEIIGRVFEGISMGSFYNSSIFPTQTKG